MLQENVSASKSSSANASRNGSSKFGVATAPRYLDGLLGNARADMDISGDNSFGGKGGANANNTFNGTITVTVNQVLSNGNLHVVGKNRSPLTGTEFIRFSGVVNPRTISGSNSVTSTQVADARIEYVGNGYINEAQTMGWLQRFFLNVSRTNERAICAVTEKRFTWLKLIIALLIGAASLPATAERIRDLVTVQGVRDNALIGYGLVVGLDGSGDQTMQTPFTTQSLSNMLSQLGITVPPGTNMQLKNVAAVMVTAKLPPFARAGQNIDVVVSSMGNAKSLRGGTLLMTPLKGVDNQVYALAQGNVLVGGAGGRRRQQRTGQSVGRRTHQQRRHHRARTADYFRQRRVLNLQLNDEDFTLAQQISDAINRQRGGGTASPLDARTIQVLVPQGSSQVRFLAEIQNINVNVGAMDAKVIINSRTGSVVMNREVILTPARWLRVTCRWWSTDKPASASRRRRSAAARRWSRRIPRFRCSSRAVRCRKSTPAPTSTTWCAR